MFHNKKWIIVKSKYPIAINVQIDGELFTNLLKVNLAIFEKV